VMAMYNYVLRLQQASLTHVHVSLEPKPIWTKDAISPNPIAEKEEAMFKVGNTVASTGT